MIDVTKLTDNELAFLVFSTESYEVGRKAREYGYRAQFVADSENIESALNKEFHRRKLHFKQFGS